MEGDRIKITKEVLKEILGVLPPGSYFNIVSFGSQFTLMF
jgi:hypothetical protein